MLYPNPAQNTFSLTLYLSEREDVEVTVFNDMGKEVYRNLLVDALNQTYNFDMTGNASGLYLVRLRGKQSASTKKLLLILFILTFSSCGLIDEIAENDKVSFELEKGMKGMNQGLYSFF